jgi:hypothetical protein
MLEAARLREVLAVAAVADPRQVCTLLLDPFSLWRGKEVVAGS